MNIVHVIASPSPGGIESYVKDLAVDTAATGHSIHVCFLECASDAGTSEEYGEEYLAELDAVDVRYFFIGKDARRRPWRGIRKMRRYAQKNRIDIYHAHLTYGILFGMFVGVPRVYTHHSVDMRVSRWFFALMRPFIDQLVGISEKCANVLSAHASRNVVTIFNGVNVKRISQEATGPRESGNTISCISVGRICVEKNYELLVRAIARLPENIKSRLTVEIAGAGPAAITARLEKRILDEDVDGVVHLLGSRNDIPELLASSHLYLMSSSSEGLPIALIEAAVSGLPCVVTDVGGCREVIQKCGNGVVVEPDNAQALADAIERLINDRARFSRYSVNALKNAKQFSIKRATASHEILYRRLLASAGQKA